ncbi:hypothetical protein EV121DRAFT_287807 [Schizophyllum commune]
MLAHVRSGYIYSLTEATATFIRDKSCQALTLLLCVYIEHNDITRIWSSLSTDLSTCMQLAEGSIERNFDRHVLVLFRVRLEISGEVAAH